MFTGLEEVIQPRFLYTLGLVEAQTSNRQAIVLSQGRNAPKGNIWWVTVSSRLDACTAGGRSTNAWPLTGGAQICD